MEESRSPKPALAGSNPVTPANGIRGRLSFEVNVVVSEDDFKRWTPERIARFFEGVAIIEETLHGWRGR